MVEQTAPSAWQLGPAHAPLTQVPEQQSAPAAQAWLPTRQVTLAQAPFSHEPEQHWLLAVQMAPSLVQNPAQVPWLQTLEQQSRAISQAAPSFLHSGPQTALAQNSSWQQPSAHEAPSSAHEVQTWLAQVPLQHSLKPAQPRTDRNCLTRARTAAFSVPLPRP